MNIWVVIWKYADGSGFGIVRAFEDQAGAEDLLKMLREHSESRAFLIEQVVLVTI